MHATIAWYRDNEWWWAPLKAGVEAGYARRRVSDDRRVARTGGPGCVGDHPRLHGDGRGLFFEWFTDRAFAETVGHRFDMRQANCSVSAAGVLRGLHFAQLPPGQAKST